MSDRAWMWRCLELARRAEGRTAPNPLVGCVIVDSKGQNIGEGFHRGPGKPHAEVAALRVVGKRAAGATLYVNLEPCRHTGRTPPCAPQVLEAGIKRLVIGMPDPIRAHRGGGGWLAKRGVKVTNDVLRAECDEVNRAFLMWAKNDRPFYTLKAAITLDGKIATRTGASKWITSKKARKHGRAWRDRLDAILVGIETVLADDPKLTVRQASGRDPIRIVLDSRLRMPLEARVLSSSGSHARVIIATTTTAPTDRERALIRAGAEVWRVGRGKRVSLKMLSGRLGKQGICSVLVEGGGEVHSSFIESQLADELLLYQAPIAFGGGKSWLGGRGIEHVGDAPKFVLVREPIEIGGDLLLCLRPKPWKPPAGGWYKPL